jgi:hypothetical protein
MKTLTEFSTLTLRKAAEARAALATAQPATTTPPPAPPDSEPPAEGVEAPTAEASEEATAEAADAAEAPAEAAAEQAQPATPEDDPAVQALASALAVQPDRAARLIEALDIVGNRIDQVRLVRVFQGEKGPHGAISRGEFHYVVDRVAAPSRGRDDRRGGGGDRGERRGGGRGDRDKPRGLGSLKVGAPKEERKDDDRPGRGEMPRAGIGWQLTAAPRDGGEGRGRGGPRGERRGRGGPRGERGDRPRGPGGPGGDRRGPRGPRREHRGAADRPHPQLGPDGQPLPADQQQPRQAREPRPPREPRLGPDGQPLPPRRDRNRPRKPIGPDENGLGPDGTPWDPERRAKRQAEREAQRAAQAPQEPAPLNTSEPPAVEAQVDAPKE